MSDDPHKRNEENEELEALLRRLVPTPLDIEFTAELRRDRDRTLPEISAEPLRMHWGRVVPLTLLCTVVTFVFALYQHGDRLRKDHRSGSTAVTEMASVSPRDQGPANPRYFPVSSHGTVVNTSSGGVVETAEGPRERLRIDYRDAYHWHDPESGTNIRYFEPRSEEVVVPLRAD